MKYDDETDIESDKICSEITYHGKRVFVFSICPLYFAYGNSHYGDFNHDPSKNIFTAIKRIKRFIDGTL